MDDNLKKMLISIAKEQIPSNDPSHDINHTLRVLKNAEFISSQEGGDLEIIVPSALFHDIIVYPKNHPQKDKAQEESSAVAERILFSLKDYPKEKINQVKKAIMECSFSKGLPASSIESKILQDSDLLESTGAISIMRTFCSTGIMNRPFYSPDDPFCKSRIPDQSKFAIDLFFQRLLKAEERMNTKTARKIAQKRTKFLNTFIEELKGELGEF